MPRLRPDPEFMTVEQRLARALVQCLLVGVALCLLFPAARGHSTLLGWMPLWLIGAPAISLLVLRRHALFATVAARNPDLVPGAGRHRLLGRGQATRVRRATAGSASRPLRVSRGSPAACAPSAAGTRP
jgi:hypothetical protein